MIEVSHHKTPRHLSNATARLSPADERRFRKARADYGTVRVLRALHLSTTALDKLAGGGLVSAALVRKVVDGLARLEVDLKAAS
jgi:hypothetical protein